MEARDHPSSVLPVTGGSARNPPASCGEDAMTDRRPSVERLAGALRDCVEPPGRTERTARLADALQRCFDAAVQRGTAEVQERREEMRTRLDKMDGRLDKQDEALTLMWKQGTTRRASCQSRAAPPGARGFMRGRRHDRSETIRRASRRCASRLRRTSRQSLENRKTRRRIATMLRRRGTARRG